jgi:hypothetical protein
MGKLIKNHWARLIVLTAASYQLIAAFYCFFWPKLFFDFLTKNLDPAVKPIPILQTINLVFALVGIAYEWPLKWLAGTRIQRSVEARILWLPLTSLASVLMYQGTNASLYYVIGVGVYFWAYCEGEVSLTLLFACEGLEYELTAVCRSYVLFLGHCLSGRIEGL